MSFLAPFLRKQFAFWRIFLYFLVFTAGSLCQIGISILILKLNSPYGDRRLE